MNNNENIIIAITEPQIKIPNPLIHPNIKQSKYSSFACFNVFQLFTLSIHSFNPKTHPMSVAIQTINIIKSNNFISLNLRQINFCPLDWY